MTSLPANTFSISAASSTERVNVPIVSSDHATGTTPYLLMRPKVGLSPTTPLYDAGLSTEPPVWEPRAAGNTPAATPTAEPLLEPPGVCSAFQGLRVGEGSPHANCVVTVFPMIIAPAFFSSATVVASYSGTKSSNMGEQQVVLMPWV